MTSLLKSQGAVTFVVNIVSQLPESYENSGSSFIPVLLHGKAALFTSSEIAPKSCSKSVRKPVIFSTLHRSNGRTLGALGTEPKSRHLAAVSSNFSRRLPTRITLAPAQESAIEIACPYPVPAPVTSAVTPDNRCHFFDDKPNR